MDLAEPPFKLGLSLLQCKTTKVIHPRTFFVNIQLREELAAYAAQTRCVDRSYPCFASQKSIKSGFGAKSLAQTLKPLPRR